MHARGHVHLYQVLRKEPSILGLFCGKSLLSRGSFAERAIYLKALLWTKIEIIFYLEPFCRKRRYGISLERLSPMWTRHWSDLCHMTAAVPHGNVVRMQCHVTRALALPHKGIWLLQCNMTAYDATCCHTTPAVHPAMPYDPHYMLPYHLHHILPYHPIHKTWAPHIYYPAHTNTRVCPTLSHRLVLAAQCTHTPVYARRHPASWMLPPPPFPSSCWSRCICCRALWGAAWECGGVGASAAHFRAPLLVLCGFACCTCV